MTVVLDQGDPLRRELGERARTLRTEVESLDGKIHALEAQRSDNLEQLEHIEALLGQDAARPQPVQIVPSTTDAEDSIADLVVTLLTEVGEPLHYRDIYERLSSAGKVEMAGKDPANSLLARYFKDERLYRPARGTYAVRTSARAVSVGSRTRTKRRRKASRAR